MSEYYENEQPRKISTFENTPVSVPSKPLSEDPQGFKEFCRKKKSEGMHGYVVMTNLSQDDDMDKEYSFLFGEPKSASYDRYMKTASTSSTKAMKAFCLDNVCREQREDLSEKLSVWPAMGISLGEKLLYMLGLSKTTSVQRL